MAHPRRQNPFHPNAPIDPPYFAGRKSEIDIIVQALTQTGSGSQQNILVTGERGIGKSSLAHLARYIAEEPRQEWGTACKFVTAYYTLFDNDSVTACCRGLVEKLRKRVGTSVGKRLVQKLKELDYSLTVDFWFGAAKIATKRHGQDKSGPAEVRRDFVRILETLWDELSGEGCNGMMLMLDELHKIDRRDNLGGFFKKVSEDLLADGYRNIMLFALGLPAIESNLAEDDASVVRIFEHVELDLMAESESEEVITNGLQNTGVKIEPQPVQELIDWSDGHPYLLQQLCFDCFAADEDDNLDMDDFFNGSIASLKQFGRKFWGKDIRDLDEDSQKIVRVLAKDKSKEVVSYSELEDQTKLQRLAACLAGLEKKGLVKSLGNKRYKLSSRALMLYISRTKKQRLWQEQAEKESEIAAVEVPPGCSGIEEGVSSQEFVWDLFLAHAGPDKTTAETLYDLLSSQARVFLDSRCLELGDDWDQKLRRAQQRSLMSVILISSRTDSAYYEREEIAAAIALARAKSRKHRVVPVYLDTAAQEQDSVPYGLRLKHGVVAPESGGIPGVAQQLLQALNRLRQSQLDVRPGRA